MGVYLSSPITDKDSIDEKCEGYTYGASSMQGWRITQEDAHNCIPDFDKKTNTSFFAVYDGHGGSEVAKYCERYFPEFVKKMMAEQGGIGDDPTKFIQSAFLAFDATLTNDDVIKELKELAGKDDDNEEEDDDDPVGRSETDMLKEEANMPLDELLAQYKGASPDEIKNIHHKENFQSPALKGESQSRLSEAGSSKDDIENGPCSSSSLSISSLSSSSSSSCKQDSVESSTVPNGGVEDENNSNQSLSQDSESANSPVSKTGRPGNNNNNNIDKITNSSSTAEKDSCTDAKGEAEPSPSSGLNKVKSDGGGKTAEAKPGGSGAAVGSSSTSSSSAAASSSSTSQSGGSSTGVGASSDAGPTSSGTGSGSGVRASKAKAAVDIAAMDGAMDTSDSDDDDEEEDAAAEEKMWEDMSDDDDDDEEDEEEGEGADEDVPMMDMTNEEPGSDSGCTACVVLMQGKKLVVANAGDSRCVLSRAGKAVELSFDHKPEDDIEKTRIEKAGGKVTADGRVNGGLNLSRAIGDHVYKRNKDVAAREQMITALPDIEMAELCDEDQFIVIACDGIWNYLSSQEVVNYVLNKLADPEKREKPSIICEELFDHCLAPNTFGDGTGCDNMTCIIILLDSLKNTKLEPLKTEEVTRTEGLLDKANHDEAQKSLRAGEDETGSSSLKRCADNGEVSEGKRLKIEEEVL